LTGILTRQDVIDGYPELVQKVVNAHVRVLKWIHTHTEQEIAAVLSSDIIGSDRSQYVKTLQLLKEFYSPDGKISEEGAANVLAAMKISGVLDEAVSIKPERFFTNQFISSNQTTLIQKKKTNDIELQSTLQPTWIYVISISLLVIGGITIIAMHRRQK
ncbi:hypothetical protein MUP77_23360, partial [Candidatus Bathyarchaeota archaeon]|nr:hypothetical protein [Candidatus Bathyarchaeota archaeon]